jgi:hypothetical protein
MAQVPGRDELILESIINDTEYGDLPKSRIEYLLLQLKAKMSSLDAVKIKGRVDTVNDLPSNAEEGWLYFVGPSTASDLDEYVYTSDDRWERIGSTVITVDSQLSTTSENPVQNKVITGALNGLGALAHKDSASTTFTPTLTTSVSNGALTVSFSQDTITVT